jgi:hypothetical protein
MNCFSRFASTAILPISASQLARITSMSQQCPDKVPLFLEKVEKGYTTTLCCLFVIFLFILKNSRIKYF